MNQGTEKHKARERRMQEQRRRLAEGQRRAAVENLPAWMGGDKSALPMRPPGKP